MDPFQHTEIYRKDKKKSSHKFAPVTDVGGVTIRGTILITNLRLSCSYNSRGNSIREDMQ